MGLGCPGSVPGPGVVGVTDVQKSPGPVGYSLRKRSECSDKYETDRFRYENSFEVRLETDQRPGRVDRHRDASERVLDHETSEGSLMIRIGKTPCIAGRVKPQRRAFAGDVVRQSVR